MSIGPFLIREMTTSVRGSRAFADRRYSAFFYAGVVLACVLFWDWWGWDRASVAAAQRFATLLFAALVAAMAFMGLALVATHVASAISSERDRKTLDALLASQFRSSEIVLGAMVAGLFRYANVLLAGVPVLAFVVFFGGVPIPWLILAGVGLLSNALLLAAFGVIASIGSRTRAQALNQALSPYLLWAALPVLFILLRPVIWRGAPTWLTTIAMTLAEGSPLGLVVNLGGLIPRFGGLPAAVGRVVAWELAGTVALTAWAIYRLRAASRGLYDVEGEASRLAQVRAALRRPPKRPPCYDDPVLWYGIYATQGRTALKLWIARSFSIVLLGYLAFVIWCFARPAFEELRERGYHPSVEAYRMPDVEPFARMLIGQLQPKLAIEAAIGQRRLEFNIVLREFTALFVMGFIATAFQYAFESVKGEQKRDTWLGLIATPLTGREILRGKMLSSIWKARASAYILITVWSIGLATGAVHPVGYAAALILLIVSAAFFAALGLLLALLASNPDTPPAATNLGTVQLPLAMAASIILTAGPMTLAWLTLFTYEDVDAAIRAHPFPEFHNRALEPIFGARSLVVGWLIGTAALAVGAAWLDRANVRGFDKAIGRPTRSTEPVDASLEELAPEVIAGHAT